MKTTEIIMIPVKDQQKAKEFYLKLGMKLLVEAPSDHGQTWIQLGIPGDDTSISLAAFHGIIFETEDINKEVADLTAKGITVEKINDTPWGKFAWMKDPDGNGLCLHEKNKV